MAVFFIADLHLGHKNIIEYCNRPFDNVDDMNEALIENWNKTVRNDDAVFFLGDFGFGSSQEIIKWGRALKGHKRIILGNHDHFSKSVFLEAGFSEVIKYPILWSREALLSHAPVYSEINLGDVINIYGHIHDHKPENPSVKGVFDGFCVSVEQIGYKPISWSEIVKTMKKRQKATKF